MDSQYTATISHSTPYSLVVRTSVIAGTVAAVVEMVPVLGIQSGALGVSPIRVFQAIASGLTGAAAYRGGFATALLGAALH